MQSRKLTFSILNLLLCGVATSVMAADPDPAALKFFETKVRPLLAENCYSCHGPEKQKSELRLDNIAYMLQGGAHGPAVVPGDHAASHLIKAVSYEDADLQMPPDGKLDDAQIQILKKWVEMGAPWPKNEVVTVKKAGEFSEEDRAWWAFQPVKKTAPPAVDKLGPGKVINAVDRFVYAKLQKEGLKPSPEAGKSELVRRVYFDLHGLPPTPEQVAAFVSDTRPDAYQRLVDELLNSPRYGERWGQHWLDLVRYAESDGYRQDAYRPNVWHYRDYVIKSFNEDKPYDQFVREQLAGDELNADDPEVLIGTAYLRHGIFEYNLLDVETQRTTILNELADTTGELFLGLSFGCARCHDHKFDPILQKDYYRLQAFFAPMLWREDLALATPEERKAHEEQKRAYEEAGKDALATIAEVVNPKLAGNLKSTAERFPENVQEMYNKPADQRTPYEKQISYYIERRANEYISKVEPNKLKGADLEKVKGPLEALQAIENLKPKTLPVAFAATDVGREAPPTIMKTRRGDTIVEPGYLTLLEPGDAKITPPKNVESTGRRTALAEWITRPDNQLATRVIVNRVWQYHFGRGLASSTSDFGRLGEAPTHPELLDWMAHEFVSQGWSFKKLHRIIMNSATYRQQAVRGENTLALQKDPENRLLWRMNPMRLDAGQARDAILTLSGELRDNVGGPAEATTQPRRTIYTRKVRNSQDEFLRSFDAPAGFASTAKRDSTTTALQSLLLVNGEWTLQRARTMATRLQKEQPGKLSDVIKRAYELTYSRPPKPNEALMAEDFVKEQEALITKERPPAPVISSPLVDANGPFKGHPLGGVKAVSFKQGSTFEKLKVVTAEAEKDKFTVEAVVYLDSLYPDGSVRTIVSRWNNDQASKGWSLGVTSEKSRFKPNNLIMQLTGDDFQDSVVYEVVASNLRIPVKTPYYVAATVSNTPAPGQKFGGTVTFYAKDLSVPNAPLQTAVVQHPIVAGQVNPERGLIIGGREGQTGQQWSGLISRVILTSGAVTPENLLVGSAAGPGKCVFDAQAGTLANTSEPKYVWDKAPGKPNSPGVSPRLEALADFCHALINSNEFIYLQ